MALPQMSSKMFTKNKDKASFNEDAINYKDMISKYVAWNKTGDQSITKNG